MRKTESSSVECHEDGKLAKRLFPPSPTTTTQEPEPASAIATGQACAGAKDEAQRAKPDDEATSDVRPSSVGFSIGALSVALLLMLGVCAMVGAGVLLFHADWNEVTWNDICLFFSNTPLRPVGDGHSGLFNFEGKPIFDCFGSLSVSLLVGVLGGSFTFLFMYYDSAVPGNFPPTPVSPPRHKQYQSEGTRARWHLGYIMVPVNSFVVFSLGLYFLRFHFNLPLAGPLAMQLVDLTQQTCRLVFESISSHIP